ncbi:phospho-2-dehydro-3-deoxyheptonate aldolase [Hypericibacter terrae]|uniref:Phospho-2-dehydro-3-deoxyheptonate aldolase n=1 Tax=Hypericibacter terrae TaxID=2602015 RepID=A0A5J6MRA1_9PROT|nr:3-deoxy-7-phosphoheptulonate synthase [Hypericibacter terrae]QEX19954.1 phospho-2-dehydro-3-deoxyheptonate aldolase [Hypericibacter terrae]
MQAKIDDLRIRTIEPLISPQQLIDELGRTDAAETTVAGTRDRLHRILEGEDDRLIVVIGPCSIHDPVAALDYAQRLATERERLRDDLEIVMRVYFEKPRTTVGWKGLINDPDLNGTFQINRGLRTARELLLRINERGVPAGCEFLDVMTPQYIADLVSWGAIGARTTESQIHRQMASGLSCPVGFKNGTNGDVRIAVEAVEAASHPHHFLALDKEGRAAIAATTGNEDGHIILRGGNLPNYDAASVTKAAQACLQAGVKPRLLIDASHGNSGKRPENQPLVLAAVADQVAAGSDYIHGVMVESHLKGGRQDFVPGGPHAYGVSITDGCLAWSESVAVLERLAHATRGRRSRRRQRADG